MSIKTWLSPIWVLGFALVSLGSSSGQALTVQVAYCEVKRPAAPVVKRSVAAARGIREDLLYSRRPSSSGFGFYGQNTQGNQMPGWKLMHSADLSFTSHQAPEAVILGRDVSPSFKATPIYSSPILKLLEFGLTK